MERYQLSQDFQDKQLQVLQRKYGGPRQAMQAALTIQRAFRRYSMAKKFADLTAHAKAEKRISRRLEFPNSSSPPPPLQPPQPSPSLASASSSSSSLGTAKARHSSADEPDSPLTFHAHHHHHHHHHHHANHRRMYVHHRVAAASSPAECHHQVMPSSSTKLPDASSSSSSTTVLQLRASPTVQLQQQGGVVVTTLDGGDSSNSCPDIQSFPLDETCVYAHSPSARHSSGSGGGLTSSSSQRSKVSPADERKSSSTSVSSMGGAAAGPSIPRWTVSRVASADKARRSPLQQHQSSPQILLPSSGKQQHSHSVSSADVDCRMLRHSLSYRESASANSYSINEVIRKRHYRTGLNIFNKKPEKGIAYLIRQGFLENSPQAVARFLITRKGLSKQMIGEYLGNLNYQFNMSALNYFSVEMDFSGMQVDTALRKFQTYFRMPGEAQKIERLMEVFSTRYCQCNPELVTKFQSSDTTFILAFAIILLNTDLHTPSLKPEKRMKLEDFVRNLRGIDNGKDVDHDMLAGIYDRIRIQEFRPGSDHVTQVMKVQQTIVAKCPNLAVPHRRLVCYCRLYEVQDPYKKERPGIHQREVFLFNDILVITKIHSRKKNTVTYAFRQSHLLAGMMVNLFETPFYPYGIQIAQKWDRKVVLMLNARNEHDRSKFVEDLKESVAEMDEMETLRLESELEKQRLSLNDNRDSGINDHHHHDQTSLHMPPSASSSSAVVNANGVMLRRSAINNSLLDLTEAIVEKITRRGSVGSLDSGMSVSCQSNSVGSFCIGNGAAAAAAAHQQQAAANRMLKEDCINRNDRNFRLSHKQQ